MSYADECLGFGKGTRAKPFNWMQYERVTSVGTSVNKGDRMIWMSKHRYYKHKKDHCGEEAAEIDAFNEYDELRRRLPRSRVSADSILIASEQYVDCFNSREDKEHVRLGDKIEKNPRSADFVSAMLSLGQDHDNWTDAAFEKTLGLGADCLAGIERSQFASSSGTLAQQQDLARQAHQQELDRKDARKTAQHEKRQSKPFEAAAMMSQLRPIWKDKAANLKTKIADIIVECNEQIGIIENSESLAHTFEEAKYVLMLRRKLLDHVSATV